jgi:hypothetical protein
MLGFKIMHLLTEMTEYVAGPVIFSGVWEWETLKAAHIHHHDFCVKYRTTLGMMDDCSS